MFRFQSPMFRFLFPVFRRRFQSTVFRFQSPVFRRRFHSPVFRRRFQSPGFRRRFQSPVSRRQLLFPMSRLTLNLTRPGRSQVPLLRRLPVQPRFPVNRPVQSRFPMTVPSSPGSPWPIPSSPGSPCTVPSSHSSPSLIAWSRSHRAPIPRPRYPWEFLSWAYIPVPVLRPALQSVSLGLVIVLRPAPRTNSAALVPPPAPLHPPVWNAWDVWNPSLEGEVLSRPGVCVLFCVLFWSPCIICLPVIVCPGPDCFLLCDC